MVEVFRNSGKRVPSPVQKETYREIMAMYDTIERLVLIAEAYGDKAKPYIKDLKKLVSSTDRSLETMTNSFYSYIESKRGLSGVEKMKMEKATREIDIAVKEFLNKINQINGV